MARILVIEDNPANRDLMVYLLTAFGHTPLQAADGPTGLSLAQSERPDLILCDLQLPILSGYEIIRALRANAEHASLRVVAVTAYAMLGNREEALAAGFDGYIAKPIEPETFVSQIEAFLATN